MRRSFKSSTWTVALLVAVGCSSGAASVEAPKWFNKPPKSSSKLYFAGYVAGASDESTARELAVQKALSELTVYCGASVKSDFSSEEVEKNGVYQTEVSLKVDVAGDEMTIRRAVVKETAVGAGKNDGFDAYALVEWPKSEYNGVLQAQRERGERALALYLEAEKEANAMNVADAASKLSEAQAILGPMRAQVPLSHEKYTNSGLVYDAVKALEVRLGSLESERRGVFMVSVHCRHGGENSDCASHREGLVKDQVSKAGFRVASSGVPMEVAERILVSKSPETTSAIRSAGYVLAVRYDARLLAKEDGFVFAKCGVRTVVYDTDADRVVGTKEVKPLKAGHVHFKGAVEKSCQKAETSLVAWLDEALPGYKNAQETP